MFWYECEICGTELDPDYACPLCRTQEEAEEFLVWHEKNVLGWMTAEKYDLIQFGLMKKRLLKDFRTVFIARKISRQMPIFWSDCYGWMMSGNARAPSVWEPQIATAPSS